MKMGWELRGLRLLKQQRRLELFRLYWNGKQIGDRAGYRRMLGVSIGLAWCDLWVGLFYRWDFASLIFYLCLLPCLPIRIEWAQGGLRIP